MRRVCKPGQRVGARFSQRHSPAWGDPPCMLAGRLYKTRFPKAPAYGRGGACQVGARRSSGANIDPRAPCAREKDRWPSGRRRTPGTRVGGQPSRGFESHPVRHSVRELVSYLPHRDVTRRNAACFRPPSAVIARIHRQNGDLSRIAAMASLRPSAARGVFGANSLLTGNFTVFSGYSPAEL